MGFFLEILLKPSQFGAALSYSDNVNMLGINLNISQKICLRTLKFHKTCLHVNKNTLLFHILISKNHLSFLKTFLKKIKYFLFLLNFFMLSYIRLNTNIG